MTHGPTKAIVIRPATDADAQAIDAILRDAFGGYYGRMDLKTELAARFTSVYAGPHFLARALSDSAPASGAVRYPSAFDALS